MKVGNTDEILELLQCPHLNLLLLGFFRKPSQAFSSPFKSITEVHQLIDLVVKTGKSKNPFDKIYVSVSIGADTFFNIQRERKRGMRPTTYRNAAERILASSAPDRLRRADRLLTMADRRTRTLRSQHLYPFSFVKVSV